MNSKNIIEEIITDITSKLALYPSIYEIRLFGSQILRYSIESDIDLAIFCKNNINYNKILKDIVECTERYHVLIHPVIYEKSINQLMENSYINENILQRSVILYRNKNF